MFIMLGLRTLIYTLMIVRCLDIQTGIPILSYADKLLAAFVIYLHL